MQTYFNKPYPFSSNSLTTVPAKLVETRGKWRKEAENPIDTEVKNGSVKKVRFETPVKVKEFDPEWSPKEDASNYVVRTYHLKKILQMKP